MHEVSLIQSINETVMAEMPRYNITKVESITLKIGEMRQVIPDTLLFAFEILSKNTPLEGAELIIESVPTKGRCKKCGQESIVENWLRTCSHCGGGNIEIISGRELEIVEFEGS